MIPNLFPKTLLASGAAAALLLGSCAYDPYYGGGGVSHTRTYIGGGGGGYGHGGYGYGHGYGGSTFSTSVLISTGNPRWGYDPYSYAYYDYTRRAYYDPYLYGYYPVGYRPPVVIGVPHPHGWRHGRVMPPPTRVRTVTLSNYRDRSSAYRQSQHSWAPRVREDRRSQTQAAPQQRGGTRQSDFRQPATTSPTRSWDRSATPATQPGQRPDQRQWNPAIREREDARRGVAPAPAARPGTAWQGADTGRPATGRPTTGRQAAEQRAPRLPAEYNRPIAVTPQAPQAPPTTRPQPAARPDIGGNRGGGGGAERGRPQTDRVPQAPAEQGGRTGGGRGRGASEGADEVRRSGR